jgi:hypothetical protein
MLKDAKRVLTAVVLTAALAAPGAVLAQQGGQMGNTGGGQKQGQGKENHPEIHAAIQHLNEAKNILEHKAANDFGGHKQKAIESVNEALKHLHEALDYDKK